MKRTYIFIALAMVAALTMVSCKNNKKANEPSQEEVQEMKQALADSVLADIDALAEQIIDSYSNSIRFKSMELTDAEIKVKPDYLLDPSVAGTLVTKSQKVNALSIYSTDRAIRKIYGMPCEEVEEAIAKLAAEVNHPLDMELAKSDVPASEKMKKTYELCKERGELAYFWLFQNAGICEYDYLLSKNPKLFFSRITDEQWLAFNKKRSARRDAIQKLARYDEEIAKILSLLEANRVTASDEEMEKIEHSKESAILFYSANADKYAARRNALLQ